MNTTTTTPITAIAEEAPHLRMPLTLDQCIKYRKLQSFAANKAVSSNPRNTTGGDKGPNRGTKRCRENAKDAYSHVPSSSPGMCQPRRKNTKTSPQHKAQAPKRQNMPFTAREQHQTRHAENNEATRCHAAIGQRRTRPHRKTSIQTHNNGRRTRPRTDVTYTAS
jgi:hypothetical protein